MSSITPKPGMTVEISMQGIEKSRLDAIEAAEAARKHAEDERITDDEVRKANEAGRTEAEALRSENEAGRKDAEDMRALAESRREDAEQNRMEAENARSASEADREIAEMQRVAAENARDTAEAARNNAEASRAQAETLRQAAFEANEADRKAAFDAAEDARASEWAEIRQGVEDSVGAAVSGTENAADAANSAAVTANNAANNANAAAEKSVRYDAVQALGDAQKDRARENIAAASAEDVGRINSDLDVLKTFTYGKHAYGENIVAKKTVPAGTTLDANSFAVGFMRSHIGASGSMLVLDCLGYIKADLEANETDYPNITHVFLFQCSGYPWSKGSKVDVDWGTPAWYYDSRRDVISGFKSNSLPGGGDRLIQIRTNQAKTYTTTGNVTITYTALRLYANGI